MTIFKKLYLRMNGFCPVHLTEMEFGYYGGRFCSECNCDKYARQERRHRTRVAKCERLIAELTSE